jgi:hypothetical protein
MKPAYFIFALSFGTVVTMLSWLLIDPSSPICLSSAYLLNLIAGSQIIPTFIAIILCGYGNTVFGEIIYWILALCQWSVVGLILMLILQAARGTPSTNKIHPSK